VSLCDYKFTDITMTIKSNPSLFKVVSPINVDRLEALLSSHPNHALVNSICSGFPSGFWPFADVEDPESIPSGVVFRPKGAPDLNTESVEFLKKQ
jgi:hypothetical protein